MDLMRDLFTKGPNPPLIVGFLYWGFCLATSYWTYSDARHFRIGPNPRVDSGFNRSLKPGEIATVVLWLGLFGLLEYFRTRDERIALADEYPSDKSGIIFYVVALALYVPMLPALVIMGGI